MQMDKENRINLIKTVNIEWSEKNIELFPTFAPPAHQLCSICYLQRMKEKINQLLEEVKQFKAESADNLEQFRIRFLGRKELMQDLFDAFKVLPGDQKREVGLLLNVLKDAAQNTGNTKKYRG